LLVEDNDEVAEMLAHGLRKDGHVVETVSDGVLGAVRALENTCEMVVLDVVLPGKSGLEVVKEIRAAGLATPVLILSGKSTDEDIQRGLSAGADDYLIKPFRLRELNERVRVLQIRAGTNHDGTPE
jgi:OmpR-family two-component system manganese-sensing response regulator